MGAIMEAGTAGLYHITPEFSMGSERKKLRICNKQELYTFSCADDNLTGFLFDVGE